MSASYGFEKVVMRIQNGNGTKTAGHKFNPKNNDRILVLYFEVLNSKCQKPKYLILAPTNNVLCS